VGLNRAIPEGLASRLFPPGSERAVHLCRAAWPRAVGEELARRTEVLALEGRTLRVLVPDGGWRRVLHRMEREILSRLREVVGGMGPTRIGFTEGFVPPPPAGARAPRATVGPLEPSAAVQEGAEAISDPELRSAFLEVAARYLERSRRHA
jgi:hypothetical protein